MLGKELNLDQDVLKVFEDAKMYKVFIGMAPSHQNEHLKWIYEAKKAETRASRIQKTIEMMKSR